MKSKPIGVRFDEEMLERLKDAGIADSPQKALNFLYKFWNTHQQALRIMSATNEVKLIKDGKIPGVELETFIRDLNKEAEPKGSSYNPNSNWRFKSKMGIKD